MEMSPKFEVGDEVWFIYVRLFENGQCLYWKVADGPLKVKRRVFELFPYLKTIYHLESYGDSYISVVEEETFGTKEEAEEAVERLNGQR